jgi:hypothetical protein
MRRSTRTSLMAFLVAVVAFAAAGCGGSEVASDEVPGPPPALTVPSDNDVGSGSTSASDNASNGDQSDSSADSGADSGTTEPNADPGTATPAPDTSGGAAAPEPTAAPDTATNDQPPAAGSPPEQFENFCEQNAGAC